MQWSYVEYLGRQIKTLEETQRTSLAALDVSMHRLHTDMHHLADNVFDIAQRLEEKLDWLAERATGEGQNRPLAPKPEVASCTDRSAPPPWESRHSSSGSVRWGVGVDGLKKDKARQGVVPVTENLHPSPLDPTDRRQQAGTDSSLQLSAVRSFEMDKKEEVVSTRQDPEGRSECEVHVAISTKPSEPPQTAAGLLELSTKFVAMDKKLEKISHSLGVKVGVNDGNDDEDRRRLKEKLKVAIEVDRRSHIRAIVSRGEVWMEYIFGICLPDQRIGKRGSR
jgi:hypothetical protein